MAAGAEEQRSRGGEPEEGGSGDGATQEHWTGLQGGLRTPNGPDILRALAEMASR